MDSSIEVTCPHCGKSGWMQERLLGRTIRCPGCQMTFAAPFTGDHTTGEASTDVPTPADTGLQPEIPAAQPGDQGTQPAAMPVGPPPDDPKVVRANRVLAGQVCPVCATEVLLGEEVVRCERCSSVSHSRCWNERGGCGSSVCAGGPGAAAAPTVERRPCPACAEDIPIDAVVCPYCAEPQSRSDGAGGILPMEFFTGKGDLFASEWRFVAGTHELVGTAPGKDEIRVPRSESSQRIRLTWRRMTILVDGKRRRFLIDDIGHMAMRAFLGPGFERRTSSAAQEALIYSIVGLFCCQIILGPVALVRAARAKEMINLYPEGITGRGVATAAQVIGAIDLIFFVIAFVRGLMRAAGQ